MNLFCCYYTPAAICIQLHWKLLYIELEVFQSNCQSLFNYTQETIILLQFYSLIYWAHNSCSLCVLYIWHYLYLYPEYLTFLQNDNVGSFVINHFTFSFLLHTVNLWSGNKIEYGFYVRTVDMLTWQKTSFHLARVWRTPSPGHCHSGTRRSSLRSKTAREFWLLPTATVSVASSSTLRVGWPRVRK